MRKWLEHTGREYRGHDLRTDGIDESRLRVWVDAVGVETLIKRPVFELADGVLVGFNDSVKRAL